MAQYHNMSTFHSVLLYSPWYSVPQLLAEINFLRGINFAITEQRQQGLARINKLITVAPFGPKSRFPVDGLYISELSGDWARKFQQLKSALSYKSQQTSASRKSELKDGKQEAPDQDYSDAQQAFWNATTTMYDQIIKIDHVYDQAKFEKDFGFDWH
jgi:hypothetical protein